MVQPKARAPQHSLAKQVLAVTLSFATIAGVLPPAALSAPLPAPSRARDLHPLPAAIPATPPLPEPQPQATMNNLNEADKWGKISVGQPKAWQYERMNSLLDGLLRDVEGISMSDLVSLDPNATNGAAVKFVQSMLEIGAQYNQGAAETNKIAMQNYAASQSLASEQIQANQAYLQQLYQQRTTVTGNLLAAVQQNASLQNQLTQADPTSATYASLTKQQQAAAGEVSALQSELTTINSQITAASSAANPPTPNLTSTAGGTAPETANTFSSFLSALPSDLTKNLVSQLQSPTYPATKRMDNFITLLYERLAREISALQDDVMRDPENVAYLVEFDVSLQPSTRDKDHVAVAEFTLNCKGCKVYSIYPGQSSYNIANYEGASKRYSLWGALATILGFGINADYRKQTDTLQGDLVQSVYMSGFQDARPDVDPNKPASSQSFGWYYGPAPFETLVSPGERTTFALISVPRASLYDCYELIRKAYSKGAAPTVPCPDKNLVGSYEDDGIKKIIAKMSVKTDWVRHDNPNLQRHPWWPLWLKQAMKQGNSEIAASLDLELPGVDGVVSVPKLVQRERGQLHVLGMEYNPVYYIPPTTPTTGGTPLPLPTTPGTATASATGSGSGTATVTVSGAGTASASSAGTTGTNASATASNPPTTPSSSTPSATDPLTGCKQDQCAAVLVKLAEPIDPNLAVTVKGLPLRRVRDWRGRATSVLPPAQSASDLISPATLPTAGSNAAPAKPIGAQNAASASLFEVDAPGPDTWMEVDSHRILLNISRTLAGERNDFPTIQIVDPAKRALFVPMDLDKGFSELIMNGFHFPTRNGTELSEFLCNHLRPDSDLRVCLQTQAAAAAPPPDVSTPAKVPSDTPSQKASLLLAKSPQNAPAQQNSPSKVIVSGGSGTPTVSSQLYPAGPYTYETFLPLFLPRRDDQPIYAYLGETGVQILIGLEKVKADPSKPGAPPKPKTWLAGKTQVVLEDRYLDLAWSLSCYPQSPMLVCDVPIQEIRNAYKIVYSICDRGACPSMPNSLNEPDPLSISSLQVWVDQYDPQNDDSFYSAVPAVIGRFPLGVPTGKTGAPDVGYRPWYFESADPEWVKLTGCHYPEFPDPADASQALTLLGRGIPERYRTQVLKTTDVEAGCVWFVIPTLALTYQEMVIEYPPLTMKSFASAAFNAIPWTAKADPCTNSATAVVCMPESLSSALFRPDFDTPISIPHLSSNAGSGKTALVDQWTIDIPVRRVDCNDSLDVLTGATGISASWKIGAEPPISVKALNDSSVVSCADQIVNVVTASQQAAVEKAQLDAKNAKTKSQEEAAEREGNSARVALIAAQTAARDGAPDWDDASKNGQLLLEFKIDRSALENIPLSNPGHILRGRLRSRIATLPDLRASFLPTQLNVVPMGTNQFALEGENAGVIDAVSLLGPTSFPNPLPAASGQQIALVTIPMPTSTNSDASKAPATPKPTISTISPETGPVGKGVTIQGANFLTKPTVQFAGGVEAAVGAGCWNATTIYVNVPANAKDGSISVKIGTTVAGSSKPFTVGGSQAKPDQLPCMLKPPAAPAAFNKNQGGSGTDDGGAAPKEGTYTIVPLINVQTDPKQPAKYMPLSVLDKNGNPLTYTLPAQTKNNASSTPKGVDSPTTTVTISKKTTVTPATTNSNPAPNQ